MRRCGLPKNTLFEYFALRLSSMASPLGFWKSSGEIWTRSEMVVYMNQYHYLFVGILTTEIHLQVWTWSEYGHRPVWKTRWSWCMPSLGYWWNIGSSVIYLERAKLSRFQCANLIINAKATARSYLRALRVLFLLEIIEGGMQLKDFSDDGKKLNPGALNQRSVPTICREQSGLIQAAGSYWEGSEVPESFP